MKHRILKNGLTIRTKLIGGFTLITLLILTVNIIMYSTINQMMLQVENVYDKNIVLNDLLSDLSQVQEAMTEYLDTKSSDSMEKYFKMEQKLKDKIVALNNRTSGNSLAMNKEIKDAQLIDDGSHQVPYVKIQPVKVTKDNIDEEIINGGFHLREEVYLNLPANLE